MKRVAFIFAAFLAGMLPAAAFACACGCGVFDVGAGAMLPTGAGGSVWLEYDYMNQSRNWHGDSSSAKANNGDKQIRSDFVTAGGQYMFDRDWGAEIEVPYIYRHFKTMDGGSGDIMHFRHGDLGDARVQGIYSGFSGDMSTGVTFGLKLPTGNASVTGFDRDTALGSGSTNVLLGAYHMGALAESAAFDWFARLLWDYPVLTGGGYRPGTETNAALGVYYDDWYVGKVKIAPLLQLIGSHRLRDSGMNGDPANTGYERLLISPGVEFDVRPVRIYGDIEVPVYQRVNGQQLVAPVLFKFMVAYAF